jgi:predicted N-formylglutamate amidohydrolase
MARHIAYDVGARGTSLKLGELLDAPVICANWSRLCIDPNRGMDDTTLVMRLYDGTIIPANRHIDATEAERRLNMYYRPYHNALADLAARREDTVIVAMHSFSPKLNGRLPRPWEIGILHVEDTEFGPIVIRHLEAEGDLTVGDNEPYAGHLPGDSVDRHALQKGRPNVLIELRHDEIDNEAGQMGWAERLAPILTAALADSGL